MMRQKRRCWFDSSLPLLFERLAMIIHDKIKANMDKVLNDPEYRLNLASEHLGLERKHEHELAIVNYAGFIFSLALRLRAEMI